MSTLDKWQAAIEANSLQAQLDRLRARMAEINAICHAPTPGHMKAVVRFQRDFDRIRALSSPEHEASR